MAASGLWRHTTGILARLKRRTEAAGYDPHAKPNPTHQSRKTERAAINSMPFQTLNGMIDVRWMRRGGSLAGCRHRAPMPGTATESKNCAARARGSSRRKGRARARPTHVAMCAHGCGRDRAVKGPRISGKRGPRRMVRRQQRPTASGASRPHIALRDVSDAWRTSEVKRRRGGRDNVGKDGLGSRSSTLARTGVLCAKKNNGVDAPARSTHESMVAPP